MRKNIQFGCVLSRPGRRQFVPSLECGSTSAGRCHCGGECRGCCGDGSSHQRRAKERNPSTCECDCGCDSCRKSGRASSLRESVGKRLRARQRVNRGARVKTRTLPSLAEIIAGCWVIADDARSTRGTPRIDVSGQKARRDERGGP